MLAANSLLTAINRDFWTYAAMILDESKRRELEEACRRVGVNVSRVGPQPLVSAVAFVSILRTARAEEGADFVHHAGYFAGGNAARRVEANRPDPNAGAMRLVAEAARACDGMQFDARAQSAARFELSVTSKVVIDRAVIDFAHGFVKGAATRLNEGSRPTLKAAVSEGGKAWAVSVDWAPAEAGGTAPATRAGKRPRR